MQWVASILELCTLALYRGATRPLLYQHTTKILQSGVIPLYAQAVYSRNIILSNACYHKQCSTVQYSGCNSCTSQKTHACDVALIMISLAAYEDNIHVHCTYTQCTSNAYCQ